MGRHTNTVAQSHFDSRSEAEFAVRLDPRALPHRFKYRTGLGGDAAEASVHLDRDTACVSRRLPSGIPMAMRIKTSVFEGVAVRFAPAADGEEPAAVLELMHADPELSLPLAVATDLDDLVADWREWGRVLALPLLVVEQDGRIVTVENRIGSVTVEAPKPRRRRSVLVGRRPRFLTRRKPGTMPAEPQILTGREITSYE